MVLPSFHIALHRKCSFATRTIQMQNTMASHREISRLTTDMNTIPGSGRPSRNSQGICNVSQHSVGYTTSQSDQKSTPVNTHFLVVYLPKMVQTRTPVHHVHHLPTDRLNPSHHVSGRMTGLSTHQVKLFNLVRPLSVIKYHL